MARAPANKPDIVDVVMPDGEVIQAGIGGEPVEASVQLVSAAGAGQDVPPDSLIIVCREPGFRRAGIEHPAVAVYPIDRFSAAELEMLAAEPNLELVAVL